MEKDNRLERVLASLDGVHQAQASPYVYSKICNRMERLQPYFSKNLAWRVAVVLVVVGALNVYTLSALPGNKATGTAQAATIAEEYSLSLPADY